MILITYFAVTADPQSISLPSLHNWMSLCWKSGLKIGPRLVKWFKMPQQECHSYKNICRWVNFNLEMFRWKLIYYLNLQEVYSLTGLLSFMSSLIVQPSFMLIMLQFDYVGIKLLSTRMVNFFPHTQTLLTSLLHASCLLELATFFLGPFHNILSWL